MPLSLIKTSEKLHNSLKFTWYKSIAVYHNNLLDIFNFEVRSYFYEILGNIYFFSGKENYLEQK